LISKLIKSNGHTLAHKKTIAAQKGATHIYIIYICLWGKRRSGDISYAAVAMAAEDYGSVDHDDDDQYVREKLEEGRKQKET